MQDAPEKSEGLRERKRRETRQRIFDVGMRLFLGKGYDATTLDEIAAAAGISRRTFFYYFESKEDILLALQHDWIDAVKITISQSSAIDAPLEIARTAMAKRLGGRNSAPGLEVDRILESVEHLRARRLASFFRLEQEVYQAFCGLWPEEPRRKELRLLAMVSAGAMRIAWESWREQGGRRPLSKCIDAAFADLKGILAPDAGR
jgi:AcrR family transcriptional regulator